MALDEPFHRLSAEEIQREIVGKAVTDEAHWWDVFLPNGVLKLLEDGELTLAQWSLDDDALCFTFPFRGRAARECFEIWRSKELIDYRRDGIPILEGVLREPR